MKVRFSYSLVALATVVVVVGSFVAALALTREPPAPDIRPEVVEVVPQACLDALDDARRLSANSDSFARVTKGYIGLIGDPVDERLLDRMRVLNAKVEVLTAVIETIPFGDNAEACEAA